MRLEQAVSSLESIQSLVPDVTGFHAMLELELDSRSHASAVAELDQRLGPAGRGRRWSHWMATRGDGKQVAWASTIYRQRSMDRPEDAARFMLFDIHARLSGWFVSSVWRALDLSTNATEQLDGGHLLPAACSARALLEGVAAFAVEGNRLLDEWRQFKSSGVPSHDDLLNFRAQFASALAQPQFGTRIGERSGTEEQVRRTNVTTIMEKFAKRHVRDESILETYDLLCDAVHPSLGSHMSYWKSTGYGSSDAWIWWHMERRFGGEGPQTEAKRVGGAIADSIVIAVDQLVLHTPRLLWFVHDFGLTTGATTASMIEYFGTSVELRRNDECPCGSGRHHKSCSHVWGD